jgi:exonuclease SbcC
LVRLLSLQANNFKKLRLASPIRFNNGITLISGLNESGKSSVLDAILCALFGRVTRPPKARNEDLVAYGASEGTVILDFAIGDRRFRVKRTLHRLKPTQATLEELTDHNLPQPLAKGQEKVNEEIIRLLGGITFQELISSTVVAQKELNKLIELHKDDRRRVINAFLNLESFNTVTTDLAEERKDLEGTGSRVGKVPAEKEKLEQLKRELELFQKNAEDKTRLVEENTRLAKTAQELQTKFQDKDRLYNNLRQYETILKTRDNLTLELSGKRKLHNDNQTRADALKKEMDEVSKELGKFTFYEKNEPLLKKLGDKVEAAKTQLTELAAVERSKRAAEQEVGDLERKSASVDTSKFNVRAARSQKPVRPQLILSILFFIGAFGAFAFGILPLAVALVLAGAFPAAVAASRLQTATSLARHGSALADLRFLDIKQSELIRIKQEFAQVKQKYDSTEQELTAICASVRGQGEMPTSPSRVSGLQEAQIILETALKERQASSALQIKHQTLADETRKLLTQTELGSLTDEIKGLQQRISELVFPVLPDGVTSAPERIEDALAVRDELARDLAATQSSAKQNLRRIDELDKYLNEHSSVPQKVKSQEELVRRLERQLQIIRLAVDGIQATGESLRARVRPGVQGYMSAIIPALTSSKYRAAVLDEDYNLQVWDPEAGEYKPKEVYSGGTEDQFLLAMRLAFALALLPEVKGQKPEFVFLDEPLGSSDEVRRSGIIDYLVNDLSAKFKQIFIISHVGGLEEHVQNIIALDDGSVASTD